MVSSERALRKYIHCQVIWHRGKATISCLPHVSLTPTLTSVNGGEGGCNANITPIFLFFYACRILEYKITIFGLRVEDISVLSVCARERQPESGGKARNEGRITY